MEVKDLIAAKAVELMGQGQDLVVSTIVTLEGSSPRHVGTKMLVDSGGNSYGTIGGSLLEAFVIKQSGRVLAEKKSRFLEFDLSSQDSASADMICGGNARVFLDYLPADSSNLELMKTWQEISSQGKNFFFLTHFKEGNSGLEILGRYILTTDGKLSGRQPSTLPEASELRFEIHNMNATEILSMGETGLMVDCIRKFKSLYCFGAGHVAVPTARIASMVGFKVFVLDDRAEYASASRFPDADGVMVIDDFNRAFEGLTIDRDSFVVIVTRGHRYDREVLEQALKTEAGYIGMISSRKKRDIIYDTLMAQGVTREQLDKVYSPIGLAIGGETPEEIAVSIVAQLISVRGKQLKA